MSSEPEEVQKFLTRLKGLTHGFDIIYMDNRPKNSQTLADLELLVAKEMNILEILKWKTIPKAHFPKSFMGAKKKCGFSEK